MAKLSLAKVIMNMAKVAKVIMNMAKVAKMALAKVAEVAPAKEAKIKIKTRIARGSTHNPTSVTMKNR